jgi:ATP-binding cassette subfamily B protein
MKYYPFLIAGAIIGTFTLLFIIAYALMKNKKEAIGFDRNMKDGEIIRRMGKYIKPYIPEFIIAVLIMLVSVAYDVISPLLVKHVEELISIKGFALS